MRGAGIRRPLYLLGACGIRKIRNAARLVEKNPDNDWFYQSEVKAVLELQEMAGD